MTRKTLFTLTFDVIDRRGQAGFPTDGKGLVYVHQEDRIVHCRNTGLPIKRQATYAIRTDDTDKGWRVDYIPATGPKEAVYDVDDRSRSYWKTARQAAQALWGHLDHLAKNSTY